MTRSRATLVLALATVLTFAGIFPRTVDALVYEATPHSTECFRLFIRDGHEVHFSYEANAKKGREGISAWVTATSGGGASGAEPGSADQNQQQQDAAGIGLQEEHTIFKTNQQAYEYDFTSKVVGQYAFCLKSTVGNAQTISVHLKVDAHLMPNADVATRDHAETTLNLVEELTDRIDQIKAQQQFAFTRDEVHKEVTERTSNNVLHWTVAEVAVLAVLSVCQIVYLKNFFEVRVAV